MIKQVPEKFIADKKTLYVWRRLSSWKNDDERGFTEFTVFWISLKRAKIKYQIISSSKGIDIIVPAFLTLL